MMKTDLVVLNPSRECYSCGSTETYVNKQRGKPHYHWYGNGVANQYFCLNCENKYYKNPKYKPLTNPRRNKKHKFCNCDLNGQSVVVAEVQNYSPTSMRKEVSQFVHQNKHKTNKQQ